MGFREELHRRARRLQRTLVLAEGWDDRVKAAARLIGDADLAQTVVLRPDRLPRADEVAALLRERRPAQVPDDARARELAANPVMLAAGLVALGAADAAVAGATCPTANADTAVAGVSNRS